MALCRAHAVEWQTVPITDEARELLVRRMRLRERLCPQSTWGFFHESPMARTEAGDRDKDVKCSSKTACERTGIKDFRIHDLRHTAASWLVTAGVPLLEVSQLLGHKSINQTQRYAHLTPESTRKVVHILKGTGTKSSTLSSTWTTKGQWGDQSQ